MMSAQTADSVIHQLLFQSLSAMQREWWKTDEVEDLCLTTPKSKRILQCRLYAGLYRKINCTDYEEKYFGMESIVFVFIKHTSDILTSQI
jgi:hypothetical protein